MRWYAIMTLCIVAKRYILCLNKWIGSGPHRTTILQHSTLKPILLPQAPHPWNHRRWCYLANKLNCKQAGTAKYSTSGIATVSMLQGYSRKCSTIGLFLAIVGPLVYKRSTLLIFCVSGDSGFDVSGNTSGDVWPGAVLFCLVLYGITWNILVLSGTVLYYLQ